MSDVPEMVEAVAEACPNSPVAEVVEAAVKTASDPSPANLMADIELALSLAGQLKSLLSSSHPSLLALVKLMF